MAKKKTQQHPGESDRNYLERLLNEAKNERRAAQRRLHRIWHTPMRDRMKQFQLERAGRRLDLANVQITKIEAALSGGGE